MLGMWVWSLRVRLHVHAALVSALHTNYIDKGMPTGANIIRR